MAAFFSPDGSLTINGGTPAAGRAAIAGAAQGFMTAFPDLVVAMDELVDRGERVLYRWTLTGTNTGPGGTGRRVRISGYEDWRIGEDGLIAESAGHFDAEDYRRQLEGAAARVRSLVPMARVRSVPASIAFYRRLGLEVVKTFTPPGQSEPSWASLMSDRAELMVTRTDEPGDGVGSVLFYAYCDDVPGMREHLGREGVAAGPIEYPFYAPRGEFRVADPDGYVVMVTHT